jgi:hypothetical protein
VLASQASQPQPFPRSVSNIDRFLAGAPFATSLDTDAHQTFLTAGAANTGAGASDFGASHDSSAMGALPGHHQPASPDKVTRGAVSKASPPNASQSPAAELGQRKPRSTPVEPPCTPDPKDHLDSGKAIPAREPMDRPHPIPPPPPLGTQPDPLDDCPRACDRLQEPTTPNKGPSRDGAALKARTSAVRGLLSQALLEDQVPEASKPSLSGGLLPTLSDPFKTGLGMLTDLPRTSTPQPGLSLTADMVKAGALTLGGLAPRTSDVSLPLAGSRLSDVSQVLAL